MLSSEFKKAKKTWVEFSAEQLDGMSSTEKQIATWLNLNLFKPREFKQPQLYLYGPKNVGKTTLVEWLGNFATVYSMPTSEDFYDSYNEEFHDLVVMDEFRA